MNTQTKSFTLLSETNGLKGIEAATLIQVLDQHNTCWASETISRDAFETTKDYRDAIANCVEAMRAEWCDKPLDQIKF